MKKEIETNEFRIVERGKIFTIERKMIIEEYSKPKGLLYSIFGVPKKLIFLSKKYEQWQRLYMPNQWSKFSCISPPFRSLDEANEYINAHFGDAKYHY
jgi:hypothetical protein